MEIQTIAKRMCEHPETLYGTQFKALILYGSWARGSATPDSDVDLGNTIMDALVTGVRDAAELVVRSGHGTIEEVVNGLEERRWKVFRQIALHMLRLFADQALPLISARLTDRTLFDDIGVRHEYVLLLRWCSPGLTGQDKAKILNIMISRKKWPPSAGGFYRTSSRGAGPLHSFWSRSNLSSRRIPNIRC